MNDITNDERLALLARIESVISFAPANDGASLTAQAVTLHGLIAEIIGHSDQVLLYIIARLGDLPMLREESKVFQVRAMHNELQYVLEEYRREIAKTRTFIATGKWPVSAFEKYFRTSTTS